MAQFSFNQFNRERQFTFDTSAILEAHPRKSWKDPNVNECYTNLESLYKQNGAEKIYQFHGCYINTKSEVAPEAPVIALDTIYVNLPQHQLKEIKAMMADQNAVRAINNGLAGFKIRTYSKDIPGRKKGEEYYHADWCDFYPDDEDEDDEDMM